MQGSEMATAKNGRKAGFRCAFGMSDRVVFATGKSVL